MHPTGYHWSVSPAGLRDEVRGSQGHKSVRFHRTLQLTDHRIRDGGPEADSPPTDGESEDQRGNKTHQGNRACQLQAPKESKKEGDANVY